MTTVPERPTDRRPAPPARHPRRAGYAVAVAVNLVILYMINVRPGWEAVPFLNADTATLLAVVNLSLVVGVAVNVLYLGYEASWFVALGGLVTTGVGLVVLARIWQVFPFTFRCGQRLAARPAGGAAVRRRCEHRRPDRAGRAAGGRPGGGGTDPRRIAGRAEALTSPVSSARTPPPSGPAR